MKLIDWARDKGSRVSINPVIDTYFNVALVAGVGEGVRDVVDVVFNRSFVRSTQSIGRFGEELSSKEDHRNIFVAFNASTVKQQSFTHQLAVQHGLNSDETDWLTNWKPLKLDE